MPGRGAGGVALAAGVVAVAVACFAPAAQAGQAKTVVRPVADAFVDASHPRLNYGHGRKLVLDGSPSRVAFLRFRIPQGVPILRATLHVFAETRGRDGFAVRRVVGAWREGKLTFEDAPRTAGRVGFSGRFRAKVWTGIDVTRLVRKAAKRGARTIDVALVTTGRQEVDLASRERKRLAPRLEIVTRHEEDAATLAAAGGIASCSTNGDEQTAALLGGIPGTIAALGDNVFTTASVAEYEQCFGPTWGQFKDRIRPTPGNWDYRTLDAAGYFAYFGAAAGEAGKGYYSYDLGAWHVVVLNSMCRQAGGCEPGTVQEQWLRADLAAHASQCTLAYWHHPLFTSRGTARTLVVRPLWQALYDAGADVVLNAHGWTYERFAPQDPNGNADARRGIRQFVVGTGGYRRNPTLQPTGNSEVRNDDTFGVLRLTLRSTGYDWQFVPVAGATFSDSGSAECH
jgi:hypothetical protein